MKNKNIEYCSACRQIEDHPDHRTTEIMQRKAFGRVKKVTVHPTYTKDGHYICHRCMKRIPPHNIQGVSLITLSDFKNYIDVFTYFPNKYYRPQWTFFSHWANLISEEAYRRGLTSKDRYELNDPDAPFEFKMYVNRNTQFEELTRVMWVVGKYFDTYDTIKLLAGDCGFIDVDNVKRFEYELIPLRKGGGPYSPKFSKNKVMCANRYIIETINPHIIVQSYESSLDKPDGNGFFKTIPTWEYYSSTLHGIKILYTRDYDIMMQIEQGKKDFIAAQKKYKYCQGKKYSNKTDFHAKNQKNTKDHGESANNYHPKSSEYERALATFLLEEPFTLQQLKTQRNHLLKTFHSDENNVSNDSFAQKINEAYTVLKPYAQ